MSGFSRRSFLSIVTAALASPTLAKDPWQTHPLRVTQAPRPPWSELPPSNLSFLTVWDSVVITPDTVCDETIFIPPLAEFCQIQAIGTHVNNEAKYADMAKVYTETQFRMQINGRDFIASTAARIPASIHRPTLPHPVVVRKEDSFGCHFSAPRLTLSTRVTLSLVMDLWVKFDPAASY